jgi:hypothetical protein
MLVKLLQVNKALHCVVVKCSQLHKKEKNFYLTSNNYENYNMDIYLGQIHEQ